MLDNISWHEPEPEPEPEPTPEQRAQAILEDLYSADETVEGMDVVWRVLEGLLEFKVMFYPSLVVDALRQGIAKSYDGANGTIEQADDIIRARLLVPPGTDNDDD